LRLHQLLFLVMSLDHGEEAKAMEVHL